MLTALSVFMLMGNARGELRHPSDIRSFLPSDQATILNEKSLLFVIHEATRLLEPSVYPIAVNRLLGADWSIALSGPSTNQLILVNPHRKFLNDGRQFNDGEFLATTLQIPAHSGGRAKVSGSTVHVSESGYVALMTPGVDGEGIIVAGVTATRSDQGQKIALDLMSDGLVRYAVNHNTLSEVTGLNEKILAKVPVMGGQNEVGGQVLLNAHSAAQIQAAVVNSGSIRPARRLVVRGASVRLEGNVPYVADTGRTQSRLLSQQRADREFLNSSADAVRLETSSESKSVARHMTKHDLSSLTHNDPGVASSGLHGAINADKVSPVRSESSRKHETRVQSAALSHPIAVPSDSTSAEIVQKKARRSNAANDRRGGQHSKHILETPLPASPNERAVYPPWKQPEWMKYLDRFSSDGGNDALNLPSSISRIDQ